MKNKFLVQFSLVGKGPHFKGQVCHFSQEVDPDGLTAMVVDHKASKLHIERVTYQVDNEKTITIYDERA